MLSQKQCYKYGTSWKPVALFQPLPSNVPRSYHEGGVLVIETTWAQLRVKPGLCTVELLLQEA